MNKLSQYKSAWILPMIAFILFVPFSQSIDLDTSALFFDPQMSKFANNVFFKWMFDYGPYPAILLGVISAFVALGALFFQRLKRFQPSALFLVLTLIAGPGLIVNLTLKDHWGRPRPREIEQFGGKAPYQAVWQPAFTLQSRHHKSFPSGHASIGFYFLTLFVLGWRKNSRWLMALGLVLGFGMGGLLGFIRVAQGGHFLSDVLVSALIVWYIALLFDYIWKDERAYKTAV